jgi:hypothetical protein
MQSTLSSTLAKISSAVTGLYNSFLGQTKSQARLNAIASYDQSNELFKVRFTQLNPNLLLHGQSIFQRLF